MYNSYPYTYGDSITRTTYSGASEAANALLAGFTLTMFVIFLAVYVLTVIGLWKVFKKAGKPGWHAIIPFLNLYDMFEIGGQKGVYIFMMFIPFVGSHLWRLFIPSKLQHRPRVQSKQRLLSWSYHPSMYLHYDSWF